MGKYITSSSSLNVGHFSLNSALEQSKIQLELTKTDCIQQTNKLNPTSGMCVLCLLSLSLVCLVWKIVMSLVSEKSGHSIIMSSVRKRAYTISNLLFSHNHFFSISRFHCCNFCYTFFSTLSDLFYAILLFYCHWLRVSENIFFLLSQQRKYIEKFGKSGGGVE